MKFATFNTNSIRARLPVIKEWLDREGPDVLCVQETKVRDKDFPADLFEEAGYHVIFKGQKSYNGVAIISKVPPDDILLNLYDKEDEQARFISARIDEKYDPAQPLLVAGDFNVALEPTDVFDPEKFKGEVGFHPDEQAILRQFLDWGLVDVFRKHEPGGGHYTFWDYRIPNALKRKMGWRIDYILGTAPLAEKSIRVRIDTEARMLEKPSDHTFLVAEFHY
jgi:exodeoxyribonuclease-3